MQSRHFRANRYPDGIPYEVLESSDVRLPDVLRRHHGLPPAMPPKQTEQPIAATEFPAKLISEFMENGMKQTVAFSAYDFGGQDVFKGLRHLFFTRNGCYLIIFDMRTMASSAEGADRERALKSLLAWILNASLHARGAPMFLVGTHKDKISSPAEHQDISDEIKRRFDANVLSSILHNREDQLVFFPVDNSAHEDPVVSLLRKQIEESVRKEEYIRKEIPLKWLRFYDSLTATGRTNHCQYVTLAEARTLAAQCGLVQADERDSALRLFHELGVLFYLSSVSEQNYVVIDPQFLVDRMADVIHDPKHHKQNAEAVLMDNAIVSESNLRALWKDEKGDHFSFLCEVMRRFGLLCEWPFQREAEESAYLVPSRLRLLDLGKPYQRVVDASLGAFSVQDQHTAVVVKEGKVLANGLERMVEWIGGVAADGSKTIVSVLPEIGGEVLLNDDCAFANPAETAFHLIFPAGFVPDGTLELLICRLLVCECDICHNVLRGEERAQLLGTSGSPTCAHPAAVCYSCAALLQPQVCPLCREPFEQVVPTAAQACAQQPDFFNKWCHNPFS
jgi:GTPase SAR1 family protein